ncbi:1656_t:CDS:2, partial [Acaulospora colombiana]
MVHRATSHLEYNYHHGNLEFPRPSRAHTSLWAHVAQQGYDQYKMNGHNCMPCHTTLFLWDIPRRVASRKGGIPKGTAAGITTSKNAQTSSSFPVLVFERGGEMLGAPLQTMYAFSLGHRGDQLSVEDPCLYECYLKSTPSQHCTEQNESAATATA